MGASLAKGQAHLSSGCVSCVPNLKTYSFSHCVNIKVEPQNFGKLSILAQGHVKDSEKVQLSQLSNALSNQLNRFLYISVLDEASDFKFSMQLGFAKAHHQIPLEEKVKTA